MPRVLIVDDDPFLCDLMKSILDRSCIESDMAFSIIDGLTLAQSGAYDLIFLDVLLPDGDGLVKLCDFLEVPGSPVVVLMTGAANPESAEQALLKGAWDYVQKPISAYELTKTVASALAYRNKNKKLVEQNSSTVSSILGNSNKIQACISTVLRIAPSNTNCLIFGETGTGKELFARAIHDNSCRSTFSFVVVDCTNIPETLAESVLFGHSKGSFTGAGDSKEGLFRQADKGTLFLDEIGDLPLKIQKSLLRVLQEKRFRPIGFKSEVSSDFRLIAATNRDLQELVKRGLFRSDLYYRLSSVVISLPPLRERGKDIEILIRHFCETITKENGLQTKEISPATMQSLMTYPWPGNVRELFNAVITAVTNAMESPTIELYHFPLTIRIHLKKLLINRKSSKLKKVAQSIKLNSDIDDNLLNITSFKLARQRAVDKFEKEYFSQLIIQISGDTEKACDITGLSRARIYQILRKHNLTLRKC